LVNCTFSRNMALGDGGGIDMTGDSPRLEGCTFYGNTATDEGGGCCIDYSSPNILNCTLIGNSAERIGGGLLCYGGLSHPNLENTVIAFSTEGAAIHCSGSCDVTLSCCDLYGNAGGDWVGGIASQYGLRGNISEDPLLCCYLHREEQSRVEEDSPCAPYSQPNPECGLIGAWPAGCHDRAAKLGHEDTAVLSRPVLWPGQPNPFALRTRITYAIHGDGDPGALPIALRIYDTGGRLVRTLLNSVHQTPGTYHTYWDGLDEAGSPLPGGVYFCRLKAGGVAASRKLIASR
jgi:hypothetical protein